MDEKYFLSEKSIEFLVRRAEENKKMGRGFKENGDPAFILTGQDKHGVYDGKRIRRLTPIECARLQGFPDDWCLGLSDTQAYKCYGNAVTVNVVKAIITGLIKLP